MVSYTRRKDGLQVPMHAFPDIDFAVPGSVSGRTGFGVVSKDEWGDYALVKGVGPSDCSAPPYEQALSAFDNLAAALGEVLGRESLL